MSKPHVRATFVLGALAGGLLFTPAAVTDAVRGGVRDGLRPGMEWAAAARRQVANTLADWRRATPVDDERTRSLEREAGELRRRCRTLQVQTAELQRRLDTVHHRGASPWPVAENTELVVPELIAARVLGKEHTEEADRHTLIGGGLLEGITKDALVADVPLIDQGREAKLASGQTVLSGRCVVGRIAETGRHVSTLQLVTAKGYKGFAQIIRKTNSGYQYGAEGILEGTGEDVCLLKFVAATAPVQVGDAVFTGSGDGSAGQPLYYGRVVHAELPPAAQEWTIHVEPAVPALRREQVAVVRRRLNPIRTASGDR